jgi:glycosyltransferase involved in cell wall biosynthesis
MRKHDPKAQFDCQIIFNSFEPVGLEDYVTYFKKRFKDFVYLKWKFPHRKGKSTSACIRHKTGKQLYSKKLTSLYVSRNKFFYFSLLPFHYMLYLFQALTALEKRPSNRKSVVFFGVNYYCTFCGIILKKIGRVDYVIYRVMDFFPLPKRGVYRYLNRLFYTFDRFCLKNADSVWFTTQGHIEGREKYGYFDRRKELYRLIPLGINSDNYIDKTITEQSRKSLVYCGVISVYHMLELVFDVLAQLKIVYPDILLNVVGSGPDEDYFRRLAYEMGLNENIKFHGYIEEGERFNQVMSNNLLGIALYKDEENFMKYTEPAKVKYYLNFGIPALVSKVPSIAKELDELRVSFAVNNEKYEIVSIIKRFIEDQSMQKEYKSNIGKFVETVNIFNLLEKNIIATFDDFGIR